MNNLKKIRKEKGLTQKFVAINSGVNLRTYSRYESNKNERFPEIATAIRIANTLGISDLRNIWTVS